MRKLLPLVAALLVASPLVADTTIYSTTDFSGWFLGSKPTISGGDLITTASTTNAALAYFETPGNQYNISVGETLSLSTTFSLVSGSAVSVSRGLYLTLQNSGSTLSTNQQVLSNLTGTTATTATGDSSKISGYTGYGLLLNPAPSSAQIGQFNYRATGNANIAGSTTPWSNPTGISNIPSGTFSLTSGNDYTLTFDITRSSTDQMTFSFELVSGATVIASSTSATSDHLTGTQLVTAFDTIAIGDTSGQTSSFQFKSVALTSSLTAVPEPSTYALIAGLVTLGLVVVRRRASTRLA